MNKAFASIKRGLRQAIRHQSSRDVRARLLRENRIALLEILALGTREVEEGRTVPAAVAFRRLRERRSRR
jgi:hypothetical protein